nr:histidine kinase dimerization/phosphoacceptor domain -containing protein [uncultured Psychroserpens sp.]
MTKAFTFILYFSSLVMLGQQDSIFIELNELKDTQSQLDLLGKRISRLVYSNPEEAIAYTVLFDSITKSIPTYENKADALMYRGMANHAIQDYENAISNYLKAIRLLEKNDDYTRLPQVYNNLAASYNIRGDANKTEEYFIKAAKTAAKTNDSVWMSSANSNLGVHYNSLQEYNKAEIALKKSLTYFENKKDSINAGATLMNIGNSQLPLKKNNEAIASYKRSMILIPYEKFPIVHSVAQSGIGIALTNQKKYIEALPYLKKGNAIAKQINYTEQIMETNNALADYYAQTRNFEEAFKLSLVSQQLKDSVLTKTQDKNMADALIEFESEKKDAQLKMLELEKEKTGQRQLILSILAIGGLSFACLIGLFFYRNKKQSKLLAKQKLMLEKTLDEKNILLRETHHRVKNSFQMVSSLLSYQANTTKNLESKLVIKEAQNRVRSMVLIHQKLYSKDQLVGIDSKEYIEDFTKDVIQSHEYRDKKIECIFNLESLVLDIETITPIGLILNELLTNVVKHAFPDEHDNNIIHISFMRKLDTLLLIVEDNGIGSNGEINESAFGLKLIKTLAKKLKGEFNLSHNTPKGTSAQLTINRFTVL